MMSAAGLLVVDVLLVELAACPDEHTDSGKWLTATRILMMMMMMMSGKLMLR